MCDTSIPITYNISETFDPTPVQPYQLTLKHFSKQLLIIQAANWKKKNVISVLTYTSSYLHFSVHVCWYTTLLEPATSHQVKMFPDP